MSKEYERRLQMAGSQKGKREVEEGRTFGKIVIDIDPLLSFLVSNI